MSNSPEFFLGFEADFLARGLIRRSFSPPSSPKSLNSYWRFQVGLIWAVICGHRNAPQLVNRNGKHLFSFSAEQTLATTKLISFLDAENFPLHAAANALYHLLYSLYFPPPLQFQDRCSAQKWNDPVAVYLACLWVDNGKRLRSVFNFTPLLAQLQFSMRLACLHLVWGATFPPKVLEHISSALEKANAPQETIDKVNYYISERRKVEENGHFSSAESLSGGGQVFFWASESSDNLKSTKTARKFDRSIKEVQKSSHVIPGYVDQSVFALKKGQSIYRCIHKRFSFVQTELMLITAPSSFFSAIDTSGTPAFPHLELFGSG